MKGFGSTISEPRNTTDAWSSGQQIRHNKPRRGGWAYNHMPHENDRLRYSTEMNRNKSSVSAHSSSNYRGVRFTDVNYSSKTDPCNIRNNSSDIATNPSHNNSRRGHYSSMNECLRQRSLGTHQTRQNLVRDSRNTNVERKRQCGDISPGNQNNRPIRTKKHKIIGDVYTLMDDNYKRPREKCLLRREDPVWTLHTESDVITVIRNHFY